MKKNIFKSICIAAAAVFLATMVIILGALYEYFSSTQQSQLKAQTELAAQGVEHEGIRYFDNYSSENPRITWVSKDGSVLFDSESNADSMENHSDREEIKQAQKNGYGESSRYSSTLTRRQIYSAKRLSDGSVLRLSGSHLTIPSLILIMFQPIVFVIIIACILAFVLASKLSKKIVKPLNSMNLDEPRDNQGYEELQPLLDRINNQQTQLKMQSSELRRKKEEFHAATVNMNEGLVLLNESGTILSINRAATNLLSISSYCVGKDILLLNHSIELQELLRKAKNGEHAGTTMNISGLDYQVNVSPVITDDTVTGIVILIFDITEKEKAEKMRREFTANASHELKTPLQSISGYAELLKNGMVREEDTNRFYENIYSESQRMIALVEDIIALSRLDEEAIENKREEVDLLELAKETVRILTPSAKQKNVSLFVSGDPAVIVGIPELLNSTIYNLTDNAIKYNRESGSVSVRVETGADKILLSVSDTGIGIPEEERERIFERFYRVDKSHSKSMGGTGLGLSIVKHAAKIHNASIELTSVIDGGTTVTIIFPKNGLLK